MFKVSFTDKKIQRFHNSRVTVVTLNGEICFPYDWIGRYPCKVINRIMELQRYSNISTDGYDIEVQGKAVCSKEDTVDEVLGERIAEARAKMTLYKFMRDLCKEVYMYYREFLYGKNTITVEHNDKNDNLIKSVLKYDSLYTMEWHHLNSLLNGQSNSEGSTDN